MNPIIETELRESTELQLLFWYRETKYILKNEDIVTYGSDVLLSSYKRIWGRDRLCIENWRWWHVLFLAATPRQLSRY